MLLTLRNSLVSIHASIHRISFAFLHLGAHVSIIGSTVELTLVNWREHALLELDTLADDFLISLVSHCRGSNRTLIDKVGTGGFDRIKLQMCRTHTSFHFRQSSSDLGHRHLAFPGGSDGALPARIILLVIAVRII